MVDLEQTLNLVELTCARLCHDLGGLIGTVGNALEMAAEENGGGGEVLAFASSAARALRQRLGLMRAAWGPEASPLSVVALRTLAEGPLTIRRISLDTLALAETDVFSPAMGRVVLNVLLLASDALARGGTIRLMGDPDDIFVRIEGQGAQWPYGLIASLREPAVAIAALRGPGSVQMPLTVMLAHSRALRLSPVMGAKGIEALRLSVASPA